MIFEWPQYNSDQNIFEFPKGMYFIGDLSYFYRDMDEFGDGVHEKDIFSEKILSDLNEIVDLYSNINTGIYTGCLGGDGCFVDKDGYQYGVDSGTIGICRVEDQLAKKINFQSWTCMMFYKKLIVEVEKEKIKIFKPNDLSILRQLGRFIYFDKNFNVEFIPLQNIDGESRIKNINFGHISIEIEEEEESEEDSIRRDENTLIEKKEVELILQPLINEPLVQNWVNQIIENNRYREANYVMWDLDKLVKKYPRKETYFVRGIYQSRLITDKEWIDFSNAINDFNQAIKFDPSWDKPFIEINKIRDEQK